MFTRTLKYSLSLWKHRKSTSKAIADKVDFGMVMLPVSEADKIGVENLVSRTRGILPEPNLVYHVYKNRRGRLNHIKVWVYFDYSTCRTTDLFVTDNNYNLLDVKGTEVDIIQDQQEDDVAPFSNSEESVWF